MIPTLYDSRNLLYSIINHHWVKASSLTEMIDGIPKFIKRVEENKINNVLAYYGDYKIDKIYEMNDFLGNSELSKEIIIQSITFILLNLSILELILNL